MTTATWRPQVVGSSLASNRDVLCQLLLKRPSHISPTAGEGTEDQPNREEPNAH